MYDVVVLGTGAAGLTTALRAAADGAAVGLFERAATIGGTSAWSGGTVGVLDVDGAPIEALYAAGNAMGSVMGMTYGGHGGTLGPGLVFGFRAGAHAAARAFSVVA